MSNPPDPISPIVAAASARQTTEDPGYRQREAVKRHLDVVWTQNKPCPICGDDDWLVDNVANISVRPLGFLEAEAKVYPLAPILCQTCGYTFFVNEKWTRDEGKP
jgi:predicted nucleic-acid-binding Zn-ribbon protein